MLFLFSSLSSALQSILIHDSPSVGGSFFSLSIVGCVSAMASHYQLMEANGIIRENEWKELMEFPIKHAKEFQYLVNAIWLMDLIVGINNRNIDLLGNAMAVVNGNYMGWVMVQEGRKGWNLLRKMSPGIVLTGLFIGILFRNPDLF